MRRIKLLWGMMVCINEPQALSKKDEGNSYESCPAAGISSAEWVLYGATLELIPIQKIEGGFIVFSIRPVQIHNTEEGFLKSFFDKATQL